MNVLLHICCGICASGVIEQLKEEGFRITGYFYNPNIYPVDEYNRRLEVVYQVADIFKFELITGEYDNDEWVKLTKGMENECEGGIRCKMCFDMRLKNTYNMAQKLKNISYIATTLSISPHKDVSIINMIGSSLAGDMFLRRDFKKNDGFKKTVEFAKRFKLYRQNYCGCIYSMRD
jgi:hypothetical protein